MVDDEGVDLIFNLKGTTQTLAVQVKSRFKSTSLVQRKGIFRAQVGKSTFQPRQDLHILFVLFDDRDAMNIEYAWLIPSIDFAKHTSAQTRERKNLVFSVSIRGMKNWGNPYRCDRTNLATRILSAIRTAYSGKAATR